MSGPGVPGRGRDAPGPPSPAPRSLFGLDLLNLFAADVRNGLGPYLAEFLKSSHHWAPGAIGLAVGTSNIASAVFQIPAGLMIDDLRIKRLLVACSGVLVVAASLVIALFPKPAPVFIAQVGMGIAAAIITPAIAAMSLGVVRRRGMPSRVSRNEGFNHGGNFANAGLSGVVGQLLGYVWVFYISAAFAVVSALSPYLIRRADIDSQAARGGEDGEGGPTPLKELLRRRDLLIFLALVALFYGSNGALLPMAGQVLAERHPKSALATLSGCIIVAQATMVLVAALVGRAMKAGIGRKPIFAVAFLVLPVRAALFAFVSDPLPILAIQVLDGVAAGVFGVVSVVIASDLMAGSGRFNLAQGVSMLAIDAGSGISNVLGGLVVQAGGYRAGFLTLAGVAVAALALFLVFMPETRPKPDG